MPLVYSELEKIKCYFSAIWVCSLLHYINSINTFKQNQWIGTVIEIDDWNGKFGEIEDSGTIGKFGSGKLNDTEDQLIEFCEENTLLLEHGLSNINGDSISWTSPDKQHWHSIDCIIGNRRQKSAI